jgi:hypothetical protein
VRGRGERNLSEGEVFCTVSAAREEKLTRSTHNQGGW